MDNLEKIDDYTKENLPSEEALKEFSYELRILYEKYKKDSSNLDEIKNE